MNTPEKAASAAASAPPSDAHILITVESDFDLNRGEVWPDDDGPEVITARSVADVMEQGRGGKLWTLRDWNLDPRVTVTVNGETVEVWE